MVPKRTIKLREANIVNVSKTQKDKKAYNSDPHLHSENVQGGSSRFKILIWKHVKMP